MTSGYAPISIAQQGDGGYTIQNELFYIHSDSISVRISGEDLTGFNFEQLSQVPYCLGNVSGVIHTDVSRSSNIELRREIFLSDDGQYAAVRCLVKNKRDSTIHLGGINPLEINRASSLLVGGGKMREWKMLRYPFHKDDIPSYFRPTTVDKDFGDAVFSRLGAVAGQGVLYNTLNVSTRTITVGPVLIIRNIEKADSPLLMFCTMGIERHLMEMVLTTSEDRQNLKSFKVECNFDDIALDPEDEVSTHWLLITSGGHEADLLKTYTETVAGVYELAPLKQSPLTVYCSWYFYTFNLTEEHLLEELESIKKNKIPLDVFQIDDGWMDNYGSYQHDPEKFPHGIKYAAQKIREAGMAPGIWICPFVLEVDSPILEKYPDLMQLDREGNRIIYDTSINDCYVVDPTAPGAMDYFREIFTRFKEWGYTYFKLDWLRAIYEFDTVRFRDPKVNRAMAYTMALKAIRNIVGPECYICGCGGLADPGNFGLVDAQRTCTDVRGVWQGPEGVSKSGTIVTIKQNLLRNYINRFYHSDPDGTKIRIRTEPFFENERQCVGVYQSEGRYTDEEAFTICAHQYLCGGLVMISERFPELHESRLALLRHIAPVCAPPARIIDFDNPVCPTIFLTKVEPKCGELGTWWTLAVANWEDETVTRELRISDAMKVDEQNRFAAFEFRTQDFMGLFSPEDKIEITIPPHGIRVLRITPWDGAAPKVLGTDLHITGGGYEIVECVLGNREVRGRVSTPWRYPITVTVGFSNGSDGIAVLRDTVAVGDDQFSIS